MSCTNFFQHLRRKVFIYPYILIEFSKIKFFFNCCFFSFFTYLSVMWHWSDCRHFWDLAKGMLNWIYVLIGWHVFMWLVSLLSIIKFGNILATHCADSVLGLDYMVCKHVLLCLMREVLWCRIKETPFEIHRARR